MQHHKASIDFDGKEYSLEYGKYAKLTNGSVMVKCADSMVLVTVAISEDERDADFMPLQVEYREKTASAGKIPGGFLKREGRPSDHEVLSSRLIDRPIRPMLPKKWRFDTQILATVYSADPEVSTDTLGAVGASAALMVSDAPFDGPIAEIRVGRIDGEYIANPSHEALEKSDMDITVGGTIDAITMVEGEFKEVNEEAFLGALDFAAGKIKELCELQLKLVELVKPEKREFVEPVIPEEFVEFVKEQVYGKIDEYIHADYDKKRRNEVRKEIRDEAFAAVEEKFGEMEEYEEKLEGYFGEIYEKIEKELMRRMILTEGRRIDGRGLKDIRPITCEVGTLPRAHGSALFTRGETQSLSTVTLGTQRDEQMIDGLLPTHTERFMLHYNFPPFCTGETGRMGVGRREIGHGHLAWRALKEHLPLQSEFPYTIRIVSDILESNGSSSMATVCAGSLALFDSGCPSSKAVAGVAMGLISEGDEIAVLSDILGMEDFLGDMDFKVAGTYDGITACQMDIKIKGLSIELMKTALEQAREGRFHILDIMGEALEKPREEISMYAPRFLTLQIPVDAIGAVIGSGGETIRAICLDTNTEINIEDDGSVTIASVSGEDAERAKQMVMELTKKPEEGEVYMGKVKEIREGLGAIVEFMPKTSGLLHISQISHERTENVSDVLSAGDEIEIKLLEITRDGKFRLSRKALLPRPDNMKDDRNRGDGGGDRRRSGGPRSSGPRDRNRGGGGGSRRR